MTKTERTATAEFRFILDDEIHAWALLLASSGFTVQARHVKTLKGKGLDGVMKVTGPAERLATAQKALALAGAELLTVSPEVLPTTDMQAIGIFWTQPTSPTRRRCSPCGDFRSYCIPRSSTSVPHLTAYASVRGPSALDEGEIFDWLLALGEPVGLDLDCIGKDDGPTEWEHMIELPKQLQREFPDYPSAVSRRRISIRVCRRHSLRSVAISA